MLMQFVTYLKQASCSRKERSNIIMQDLIQETARAGQMVIWEEAARDGGQAKTLMNAAQRIALARAQGAMFGQHGPNQLIFGIGFPSICREEFEIVRQVAAEVDNCAVTTAGRATKEDIDLNLEAVRGSSYGRFVFFFPVSAPMCQTLLHESPAKTLEHGLNMARYALDRADGLPIDVALADAPRADPNFVAEAALALAEEGVALVNLCDTVGDLYPYQSYEFTRAIVAQIERAESKATLAVHLHNDLGFGLANNLEAIRAGVRVISTSWLGLAERTGLAATEQVLFALSHKTEALAKWLGFEQPLWRTAPDLKQLVPLAQQVSQITGVPLKVTDPIVGSGVNSISTGTPFTAPALFHPFNPQEVLGVPSQIVLTHLASLRVVSAVAEELGFELNRAQAAIALSWVKREAYQRNQAVVPRPEFASFLMGLTALA